MTPARRPGPRRPLACGVLALAAALVAGGCTSGAGTSPSAGVGLSRASRPSHATRPVTASSSHHDRTPTPHRAAPRPTPPAAHHAAHGPAPEGAVPPAEAKLLAAYRKEPQIGPGATGRAVATLQQRLLSLGYWVEGVTGDFDDSTEQAVWALQKVAGIAADGVVGPRTWKALAEGPLPRPRTRHGYVIEVDLSDDVLMFVDNGRLEHVLNTSTGGGYWYYSDGGTYLAATPTGIFHTYYAIDAMVTDSLGQLWRPRYFTGGFAIHGEGYVPAVPVSHGCVRVSDEAIDWIWAEDLDPIGTEVDVYR